MSSKSAAGKESSNKSLRRISSGCEKSKKTKKKKVFALIRY